MIERVLFFFKQEHGAISYTMQPFDIGLMVKRIVKSVEGRSLGKMSVELEVDGGLPDVIGDVEALEKVVTNLLDNALKYGGCSGSGAPPWLEYVNTHTRPAKEHQTRSLEFEAEKLKGEIGGGAGEGTHKGSPYGVRVFRKRWRWRDWIVVSIADSGQGIAVSEQKKIFRRFYRVGSESHSHVGGIGLGLSLCADIVRAHRGRLIVKSALGEGAEFSIWLRIR